MRRRKYKKERKTKIIPKDNVVDWNFDEIKKIAEQNHIKMFIKANGKVLEFKSRYDEWIVPVDNQERILKLYHDVRTNKPHLQNVFFDCKFMLDSTCRHDDFRQKIRGSNLVDDIIYRYKHGKIPKFKMN